MKRAFCTAQKPAEGFYEKRTEIIKGKSMKKDRFMITAAMLCMALGAQAPVSTFAAQSPDFAKSSEEWARLEDNKLEYDEVADLIHEYNPTVQSNSYDYKKFVDTYGNTNEEIASEYRSKASELLNNMSGEDDASSIMSDAQAELQAKQLNSQADNNTDDSTTKSLGYAQSEAQLVMNAKSSFISYYSSKAALETARTTLETMKDTLTLTKAKTTAGTATESELRSAEKNVSDQETAVKKAEEAVEESRQKLIVMLGWKSSDEPEIGELPEISSDTVDAIDLDADLKKAAENNYTLKINKRKLNNASDSDNVSVLNSTISGNEKSISVSVKSAYSTLKSALMSYESAKQELVNEEKNMQTAEARYSAGLSTRLEHNNEKNTLELKKQAVESAKCSLVNAYMTYESYVAGLANAG